MYAIFYHETIFIDFYKLIRYDWFDITNFRQSLLIELKEQGTGVID